MIRRCGAKGKGVKPDDDDYDDGDGVGRHMMKNRLNLLITIDFVQNGG